MHMAYLYMYINYTKFTVYNQLYNFRAYITQLELKLTFYCGFQKFIFNVNKNSTLIRADNCIFCQGLVHAVKLLGNLYAFCAVLSMVSYPCMHIYIPNIYLFVVCLCVCCVCIYVCDVYVEYVQMQVAMCQASFLVENRFGGAENFVFSLMRHNATTR